MTELVGQLIGQEFEHLVGLLIQAIVDVYDPRLVSVVLFGSVARGDPGPQSDVNVLIVADRLPPGRIRRVSEFKEVEARLRGALAAMHKKGLDVSLSPVFKTPEEVRLGRPMFLDMVEDGRILFDRGAFMSRYFDGLRERLKAMGARRLRYRGAWYWDLNPRFRPGDGIDI